MVVRAVNKQPKWGSTIRITWHMMIHPLSEPSVREIADEMICIVPRIAFTHDVPAKPSALWYYSSSCCYGGAVLLHLPGVYSTGRCQWSDGG